MMGYKTPNQIEVGRIGIDVDEIKDDIKAVTFTLNDYIFGVDVSQVAEVFTSKQVTAVPKAPGHVLGVINLRGQIITVIDLKKRLNIGKTEYNYENLGDMNVLVTVIGEKKLGMAVDTVSNVITIPLSKIETKIDLVSNIKSSFLRGVGKITRFSEQNMEESKEDLIVLLNLNAILSEYEIDELSVMDKSLTERAAFERAADEIELTEEELKRLDLINIEEDIDKVTSTTKIRKKSTKKETPTTDIEKISTDTKLTDTKKKETKKKETKKTDTKKKETKKKEPKKD
ncbi:MAG: chemotaxis protein CheW [Candidatus Hodarchaeales archaeon]|jgi:purine-binding chemotaxis protein CheW